MGRDLFERFPDLCAIADEILGIPIRRLCLEDPDRLLRSTAYTQPALFVVNALAWLEHRRQHPPPAFLAGHSLGEYNALFAAGCFDFATGLRLVQRRGQLMAEAPKGGMAAVLDLDIERIQRVLESEGAAVDIANLNSPQQVVLAGPKDQLEALVEPLERAGARRCVLLNVDGAFHSRYMEPCAERFAPFLRQFRFSPPQWPVLANTTGRPYGDDLTGPLVAQLCSPVRWTETLEYLLHQGVRRAQELGPGKVLDKLWNHALDAWKATTATETSTTTQVPGAASEPRSGARPLGSKAFRRAYDDLRWAYVVGSPMPGLRTPTWVAQSTAAGLLAFLDIQPATARQAIAETRRLLRDRDSRRRFGVSLHHPSAQAPQTLQSSMEELVDIALELNLPWAEAVAFRHPTEALVRFRWHRAPRDAEGRLTPRRLLITIRHSGEAQVWAQPPPNDLIEAMLAAGTLSAEEGVLARRLPMASDLCAVVGDASSGEEADLASWLPTLRRQVDVLAGQHGYAESPSLGAGGALGTPEAIASAFLLGADFVHPGPIHMVCVESPLRPEIRRWLADLRPGDTCSAPAADGFRLGARRRVVKKGTFFAARAQRLYDMLRFYPSLDAIPPLERAQLENTYFKRSLDAVCDEVRSNVPGDGDPKQLMAAVFCHYLHQARAWALDGDLERKVDFHIPCDASMAACNLWLADSDLASLERRTVDALAERLMQGAADFLQRRFTILCGDAEPC